MNWLLHTESLQREPANPRLRLVEVVNSVGSGSASEDRVGCAGNVVWVADGATQIEATSPFSEGTEGTWIADIVNRSLLSACSPCYDGNLSTLVEAIASQIRSELQAANYPENRTPPVASLAIARLRHDHIDIATLGDASVFIRSGSSVHRIFDDRFLANERNAATAASHDLAPRQSLAEGIIRRRRRYIRGTDGPIVLSGNPETARDCKTESMQISSEATIVVASDGFMRLQDCYSIVPSSERFLERVETEGLRSLLRALREHENHLAERPFAAGFKRADDAAALLARIR